jgi:Fe-S cluster assembly ATP-binding protein
MLEIENLSVETNGKRILHNLNLTIASGETHVLFGPNASDKTTLLMTIMGFPQYKVTQGRILFKGKDITHLSIDKRARLGIGIAFQRPPSIRGVKVRDIAKSCLCGGKNGKTVETTATKLNVKELLDRDVNLGFSGGELKLSELFQLTMQDPDLILLDEPDSGVDLENITLGW